MNWNDFTIFANQNLKNTYLMNKSTYLLALLAILLLPAFTSCGDDKIEKTEFNDSEVPYDGKSERTFLEETATTFLGYFNPGEQRQLIQSLDHFVNICEESDCSAFFPETAEAARGMREAVASDDYLGYSRAATNLALSLSMFKGFYQHNSNIMVWQKLEDSDDVRLRYWDGTSEYNMSLSGSQDTWKTSVTADGETMDIEVPKILDFTLVAGSTAVTNPNSILTIKLKTDFKDSDRLNLSSEIKAANIFIQTTITGNNSSMEHSLTFSIDNVSTYYRNDLFSIKTKVTGNNLCSTTAWQKAGDNDAQALGSMISNASSTLMILQRVQIKSDITDMKTFIANCDPYFDKYNSSDPRTSAEQAAKGLAAGIKAEMFFTGDKTKVRATLGWEACRYDDYYDEWGVRPLIIFTSDNTPYSFEEYFGNSRFLSVENQFGRLFKEYASFFRHHK